MWPVPATQITQHNVCWINEPTNEWREDLYKLLREVRGKSLSNTIPKNSGSQSHSSIYVCVCTHVCVCYNKHKYPGEETSSEMWRASFLLIPTETLQSSMMRWHLHHLSACPPGGCCLPLPPPYCPHTQLSQGEEGGIWAWDRDHPPMYWLSLGRGGRWGRERPPIVAEIEAVGRAGKMKKGRLCIGLSRWLSGKESACQCRRQGFDPWVRKIPWRRK